MFGDVEGTLRWWVGNLLRRLQDLRYPRMEQIRKLCFRIHIMGITLMGIS